MSVESPYELVSVKDDPEAYRIVTEDYWNWVHELNCDTNSDRRYLTFIRDNCIGGPDKNDDNIQEINRPVGTNIFFPVYHAHFCKKDEHPDGNPCGTTDRCLEAVYGDLSKIRTDDNGNKIMWANISINGAEPIPITKNFEDHTVTLFPFILKVGPNKLNREPQYHLGPGIYTGAASGTYLFLKNFKEGTYVLDFGGEASNFRTRSIYTLTVS